MTDLEMKIIQTLRKIPKGKVMTYQSLAKFCGIPNGARFVGNVMAKNPWPEKYPCYKVIKTNGEIGQYSGGEGQKTKIKLLQKNGIKIKNGKVVNLEKYLIVRK